MSESKINVRVLGDEIAALASKIHAATHRLLVMIAEFDERGGWQAEGHASCAHWLSLRTGIDMGACREKVRAARALRVLPRTSESMSKGELSFSKVRALTRVATKENEARLVGAAKTRSTANVERMVRGWKRDSRLDEAELERQRHESRMFSVFPDNEGMYVVRGRLDPEVGAALMRAIEAGSDELFKKATEEERKVTKAAQRRADAVGLLADWALSGQRSARAERYQVVLHVTEDTLSEDREPGTSELEDGTRVSAETSRRLSCDTGLVLMRHGACRKDRALGEADAGTQVEESGVQAADGMEAQAAGIETQAAGIGEQAAGNETKTAGIGEQAAAEASAAPILDRRILSVGRRTRTIPPSIRRALDARDRGCVFPGCSSRFTEGHHIRHWANGGPTNLGNLVSLCRRHHRAVHEGGLSVELRPDKAVKFVERSKARRQRSQAQRQDLMS